MDTYLLNHVLKVINFILYIQDISITLTKYKIKKIKKRTNRSI